MLSAWSDPEQLAPTVWAHPLDAPPDPSVAAESRRVLLKGSDRPREESPPPPLVDYDDVVGAGPPWTGYAFVPRNYQHECVGAVEPQCEFLLRADNRRLRRRLEYHQDSEYQLLGHIAKLNRELRREEVRREEAERRARDAEDKVRHLENRQREAERKAESLEAMVTCVACMAEPRTRAPDTCGHFCLCEACAVHEAITCCPMCKIQIKPRRGGMRASSHARMRRIYM
jgi:hypothetical protein